jgi:hypothetical protein
MLDTQGNFFLGRLFDVAKGKLADKALLYDPADLTTHALVTGMTGSGKTGLCVGMLEEAALQNIPAIIIDPKGDLTNLLLHFPDLLPEDFQPWLDADAIRREGKALEKAAQETAEFAKKSLADWGIDRERLIALKNAAEFAVYTPGSDAGIPVSVLSSLGAPDMEWAGNREVLRERISSTVTAILGLVGMDNIDPLRSREHILLSNIFENAWSQGKDLDLTELILQSQNPPFEKLGAFPLENFFPAKDRMELAILLNNILAAPGFEVWREGQSLDIKSMLWAEDGRPRHSIFYIAHLSDAERMFFVTLLLSAVETWMRAQSGSTSLRALVYMDEIFGYMPPLGNPPSKMTLLRMLKQARAFGVGMLLATQNPVDVDYKGLSNTGTWIIGKLQTDQDKQRLLDGLESATGGSSRGTLDKLISALGKRVFVLHNVHEKAPVVFQTRFAMNYLAGPLTRAQIPALNELVGASATVISKQPALRNEGSSVISRATKPVASSPDVRPIPVAPAFTTPKPPPPITNYQSPISNLQSPITHGSITRPSVPSAIAEYFLPMNYGLTEAFRAAGKAMTADARQTGILYKPALAASAQIRFLDRKYGVDAEVTRAALVESPDRRGSLRWDDFVYGGPSFDKAESAPAPGARFDLLAPTLADAKLVTALQKDFVDWVYRTTTVTARANDALKVYGGPDVSQADFMKACSDAAREARDAEIEKQAAKIDRQIATLQDKLSREERELQQDESELSQRKMEELGTGAENIIGLFTGSRSTRRLSSSLTKRRMTEQAKSDVEESVDAISQYKKQLAELEKERQNITEEVNARWGDVVNQINEITLNPKKTDIYVNLFGVAWTPYYLVELGGQIMELPAFGAE